MTRGLGADDFGVMKRLGHGVMGPETYIKEYQYSARGEMRPTKRGGREKKRQNRHQTSMRGPGTEFGAASIIAYGNKKGRSCNKTSMLGPVANCVRKPSKILRNRTS